MKKFFIFLAALSLARSIHAGDILAGNSVEHLDDVGYFINVWDHRKETLAFMESSGLQGGGPTWMAIIRASLEKNSPKTLQYIEFDDEGDVLLVRSKLKSNIDIVHSLVEKAMDDKRFRQECIDHAKKKGYLE